MSKKKSIKKGDAPSKEEAESALNIIKLSEKDNKKEIEDKAEEARARAIMEEKQEIEIERSLEFLQLVGSDLKNWTMCYPYGNYNHDTLNILNSKGCKLALTTKTDIAVLQDYKRFELPRLDTNEIPMDPSAAVNTWFDKA